MQPRHARRRPTRALVLLALLVLPAAAGGLLLRTGLESEGTAVVPPDVPAGMPAAAPVGVPASGAPARAASVLRSWDRARSAAWAEGSVAALRRLYVGRGGASDVRLLGSYLDRGLRVADLRVQVLALEVLAHRPDEWRLRVTDRLASGTAVGAGGRQPLPRDRATTRTLRLVRVEGRWRMAAVRPGSTVLSPQR